MAAGSCSTVFGGVTLCVAVASHDSATGAAGAGMMFGGVCVAITSCTKYRAIRAKPMKNLLGKRKRSIHDSMTGGSPHTSPNDVNLLGQGLQSNNHKRIGLHSQPSTPTKPPHTEYPTTRVRSTRPSNGTGGLSTHLLFLLQRGTKIGAKERSLPLLM